ncbi:MAG: hypothetical protein ABI566_01540 [Pseudolysinimonas sp.]
MRRPVAVAVTGLALCLLAGCFPVSDPVVEPTFPAEPLNRYPLTELTDPAVLEYCPAQPAEHFEGFTAHEVVYICRGDEHRATDGTSTYGPWETVYRVVDPTSILERYSLPNDTRIVLACPRGDLDPLIVWVHSGGAVTAVYAPVNGCGYARGEMVEAYQKAERELIVEVDTNGPVDEHDTPAEH